MTRELSTDMQYANKSEEVVVPNVNVEVQKT